METKQQVLDHETVLDHKTQIAIGNLLSLLKRRLDLVNAELQRLLRRFAE
jgi:hypothetical protein